MSEERKECSSSDSQKNHGVRGCPIPGGEDAREDHPGLGRILRGLRRNLLDAFT